MESHLESSVAVFPHFLQISIFFCRMFRRDTNHAQMRYNDNYLTIQVQYEADQIIYNWITIECYRNQNDEHKTPGKHMQKKKEDEMEWNEIVNCNVYILVLFSKPIRTPAYINDIRIYIYIRQFDTIFKINVAIHTNQI